MPKWTVYLFVVCAACFWGANFNVGKIAVEVMNPMSVVAWRFIMAAALMMLITVWMERTSLSALRKNWIAYILLGVIGIFATNACLFVGLKHTSPMNAALIMATNPLVTTILAGMVLREHIRANQMIGIAISFAGVLFVITGGSIFKLHAVSMGDVAVLVGNICWASYGVFGRKWLKQSPPLATSTFTMLIGAICFLPFASTSYIGTVTRGMQLEAWSAIGFMAIFGSVLAYLWWNKGILQIGASRTSIFFNLVPVSTLLITVLSGGTIQLAQVLGVAVVLFGVILSSRNFRIARTRTETSAESLSTVARSQTDTLATSSTR